jgi:transcriptional regulator with XRE-family HTH domain
MTNKELITSKEYWMAQVQLSVFEMIENYRKNNNLNKAQLAARLGVSKSYITQILNGDFDHKVSKLVDLALAFGKLPVLNFKDVDSYIEMHQQSRSEVVPVKAGRPGVKKTPEKATRRKQGKKLHEPHLAGT